MGRYKKGFPPSIYYSHLQFELFRNSLYLLRQHFSTTRSFKKEPILLTVNGEVHTFIRWLFEILLKLPTASPSVYETSYKIKDISHGFLESLVILYFHSSYLAGVSLCKGPFCFAELSSPSVLLIYPLHSPHHSSKPIPMNSSYSTKNVQASTAFLKSIFY